MDTFPILSIVIPCFNGGTHLEQALLSVLNQKQIERCEVLIADGGSTDESIQIIRKYESRLYWWCSERDNGQSDAFNKAFKRSRGRYVTWLNSDDILLPDSVDAVVSAIEQHNNPAWLTANVVQFDDRDCTIVAAPWGPHWLPDFLQGRGFPLQIFGPTVFLRRDVYLENGDFDESLHYAMDTDYWCRLAMSGIKQCRVNKACWAFRMHESSKTAMFSSKKMTIKQMALREKAQKEALYIRTKTGFSTNRIGKLLLLLLRIIDGSILVAMIRRVMYVGRKLDVVYE